MFTALGSPKGALIGLSAAVLILAITYSFAAAPMRAIDAARIAPQPITLPASTPTPAPVVEVASLDDIITGAIAATPDAELPQVMPGPIAGSAGFIDALAELEGKKYADAYACR